MCASLGVTETQRRNESKGCLAAEGWVCRAGPEAGRLVLGWQWPARALLDSEETAGEWAQLCQRWQFGRQLTTDLELEAKLPAAAISLTD
eukprot:gene9689-biopygen2079